MEAKYGGERAARGLVAGGHNSVVASNGAVINLLGGRVDVLSLETGATANVVSGGVHSRFWVIDGGRLSHVGGRTNSIHIAEAGIGDVHGGAIESLVRVAIRCSRCTA